MSEEYPSPVSYRDIPSHAGFRIGDDGSLWSCWGRRRGEGHRSGFVAYQSGEWHRLKVYPDVKGYLVAHLKTNGVTNVFKVHRLVLEAFVGPRPEGMECRHLDGDKSNNRLVNLRWGTSVENAADNKRLDTLSRCPGVKNGSAKLTPEIVIKIREMRSEGVRVVDISQSAGVTTALVYKILRGELWKSV